MLGGAKYWTCTAATLGLNLRSLNNTPTLQLVFLEMPLCSLNVSLSCKKKFLAV